MIKFKELPFNIENVYLTSDTHYSHRNICRSTSTWEAPQNKGCRNFDSLEKMNQTIVKGINDTVGKDDLLIHCGDWSFGKVENIVKFRESINCENIILLQGNHDHHLSQDYVDTGYFWEFTQIGFYQIESLKFVCCHYPMPIWHQSHHNVPLFYGHVHGSYSNVGKSLDVGIDNVFKMKGEYRPIALREAYDICSRKEAFLESHHNEFVT